jgi:hypothetical protein
MLVPEAHQYGGTWAFYVIAPLILCGVVAFLWLIVKGAIGVFGQKPRGERLSTIPSTTGSSSRTAGCETPLPDFIRCGEFQQHAVRKAHFQGS